MQKTVKGKVSFIFFLFLLVLTNLTLTNINLRTSESDNLPTTNSLSSDYEFEWKTTWGSGYDDIGVEVSTDSYDNVYLVGYSDTTGSDNCDIKIFKYDPFGVEQWSRTWGGSNDDKGYDICIDSSNNILIIGYTKSLGDSDGDIIIIKYDTLGNEIWNKTWGGSLFDYGTYIMKDSSDNFFIVGRTHSFGDTTGDALLVKFDNNFEEQWNKTWGGNEPDIANKVEKGSDGYLYVVGHSDSVDSHAGYSDVVLLKYDDDGNYQWERTWGTSYAQRGVSLALDSNDNIYITGYSFGHPASSGKGYLLKYDSSGTYQWERIWGVNGQYGNYFYNIIIDDKDELYISGCTKTYGIPDNYDTLLLNYDTSGNQNWYKYWAGNGFEVSPGICMDAFSNIYLAGYTDTDSAGGYDVLLLKYKNTTSEPPIPPIPPIPPDFPLFLPILLTSIGIGIVALISIIFFVYRRKIPRRSSSAVISREKPQLEEKLDSGTVQVKFCPFCGFQIKNTYQFCVKCGGSLKNI